MNSAEEIRKLLVSIEHKDDHEINEPEITGNSAEDVTQRTTTIYIYLISVIRKHLIQGMKRPGVTQLA